MFNVEPKKFEKPLKVLSCEILQVVNRRLKRVDLYVFNKKSNSAYFLLKHKLFLFYFSFQFSDFLEIRHIYIYNQATSQNKTCFFFKTSPPEYRNCKVLKRKNLNTKIYYQSK